MNNLKIMSRARIIEKCIKHLREFENDLRVLQDSCSHDVVVVTYKNLWEVSLDVKCLFCGCEFNENKVQIINEKTVFNLDEYFMTSKIDKEELFSRVRQKYEDIASSSEISNEEIKTIIEEALNPYNPYK